jgi:hypothetical protein
MTEIKAPCSHQHVMQCARSPLRVQHSITVSCACGYSPVTQRVAELTYRKLRSSFRDDASSNRSTRADLEEAILLLLFMA